MSDRDQKFFLSLDCDGLGAQAQVWRGDADGTRTLLACVGHETRDGGSIGSGFDPFAEGEPFEIPLAPVEPVPQKRCDNRYMSISGATVRCIGVEGHDDPHVYRLGDRDAEVEPVPAPPICPKCGYEGTCQ